MRIPLADGGLIEKGEPDSSPRHRKDKMQPSQDATRNIWVGIRKNYCSENGSSLRLVAP